jgi:hypothetical protein
MATRVSPRSSAVRYVLGGALVIVALAVAIRVLGPPTWSDLVAAVLRVAPPDKSAATDERANANATAGTDTNRRND